MKAFPTLGRPVAFALLIVLWAAIFLPALGAIEIKGEEIRRIMPGVNMLESGNWIVPQFNGLPYLRKPPLVNWAIALSIKTFGRRTERTVRLPSVLAMLALGLVMLATCSEWLGINTALAAALIALTTAGLMEKGRLAEIEAIYIALFGMAFSCWLGWSATGRSLWLIWPVTGLLLGLGLLAKGPPHLVFFYAIAGFIAWNSWRKKGTPAALDTGLASWAHLCGLLIMLGVFALWCIPYLRQSSTLGASGVWARQMEQRLGEGSSSTILINFIRSLVNFLPWAIALPLFWRRATLDLLTARDRLIVESARWPIAICAFALMFIPGMLPRYTLPLVIPFALLLALVLKAGTQDASLRWPLSIACLAGFGWLVFAAFSSQAIAFFSPFSPAHLGARDFAAQINSKMPPGNSIYIFNPTVQPQIFYIHGRLIFQDAHEPLPADAPFLLAPEKSAPSLRQKFQQSRILVQLKDQGGTPYDLLSLHGQIKRKTDSKPVTAPPTAP